MFENKYNKWAIYLFRITLLISIVGISLVVSDTIFSYNLSDNQSKGGLGGNLVEVVISIAISIFKGMLYPFFKVLVDYVFPILGWFVVSSLIEKTHIYNYILNKTNQHSLLYGGGVWLLFCLTPILVMLIIYWI